MKNINFLSVFFSCVLALSGCHSGNKTSRKNAQIKDTRGTKVYITDKKAYPFIEESHPDSTFKIDSSKITISISYELKGNYDVLDTPWCGGDTCHIDAYQNVYIHIKIKALTEKEIVISKELLAGLIKNMNNIKDYQLSYINIDSIDMKKKQIIFKNFVALLPSKDDGGGLFINYMLPLQGEEKSVKFIRMDTATMGEDSL